MKITFLAPHQYHLDIEDRLAVLLSNHDIHCGWTDEKATYLKGVPDGYCGDGTYQDAIQMGINIVMYALSH